jgi:predicted Zn-dependent peptidase
MKKVILENGIRIIYKQVHNNLTSFSIALEAGANVEREEKLGIAHAVEHMVFKGTKKRNEFEINKECDEIFGFNNAMTNYPYVVYYGTCLSTDFEKGIELYSDIVLNPSFPEMGFKEELNVILEELKEWKDDLHQHCEDEMFYNAFNERRIKELIIGNENSIQSITLEDIKDFYSKYYIADNCVISVVSSLEYNQVINTVKRYFGNFNKTLDVSNEYIDNKKENIYEDNIEGIFTEYKKDIQGTKIQYCFPIHKLNRREIQALRIFNAYFGEGTSSLLYDQVRTKKGLVYDISSIIKNEKGIKIFKISLGTSPQNVNKAIELINECIEKVKNSKYYFTEDRVKKFSKRIRMKRLLALEKSIQQSVNLAVYEIMYNRDGSQIFHRKLQEYHDYKSPLYEEMNGLENITGDEIQRVINKTLANPTIQVITAE